MKLNNIRNERKYENPKAFVIDLMGNEGVTFIDTYGRNWMYENFNFFYKDPGETEWIHGLHCLHLYGTHISKKNHPVAKLKHNGQKST